MDRCDFCDRTELSWECGGDVTVYEYQDTFWGMGFYIPQVDTCVYHRGWLERCFKEEHEPGARMYPPNMLKRLIAMHIRQQRYYEDEDCLIPSGEGSCLLEDNPDFYTFYKGGGLVLNAKGMARSRELEKG